METILFFTDHYKGHMIPTFALAHQLRQKGYDVHYFGIADAMEVVQKEGFETHTVFEDHFP